ncbi:MAG: hypothetical protein AB1733_14045 [Thermodesulfobacteriota bacterium]
MQPESFFVPSPILVHKMFTFLSDRGLFPLGHKDFSLTVVEAHLVDRGQQLFIADPARSLTDFPLNQCAIMLSAIW